VAPAAVEAEAASLPPEIVTAAAPAAEAAASPALARVEAQPAASSAAQPIAAKPAPTAAFKPAAAAAALLARPGAPSAIAREAAGAAASAAALSAARAGMAAPAPAQPAPIAADATQVPAIMAMPESEPPAFLAAAPLGVASGFFSPWAERIGDTARPAAPGAQEIANPADPPNSADALFADGQAGAPPSEAGKHIGQMALGASQAVSSGAAIAASNRDAVDEKAERQARTFSAAIRKSLLPQGAAPASAPVSGSASARSEPFPAPAIQPQPPFEAPIAAATDIPAEGALSQTAQAAQTALQAPASLAEAQAPSPAVPPAAIAETVAAAASPSEVPEFPARAAPAAVGQTVPAPAAPVVPSPQEVLSLLSSLIAERKTYPEAARRRKTQGSVGLALKVAADGSLASARVEKKSGSAILDRAALDLVKGLFPLALLLDEPMEIALSIEYRLVN
jgi:TonB family protein